MATKKSPAKKKAEKEKALHIQLVKQMLTLATSGFGLVAALAWNSLVQDFVNNYIKKLLPASGMLSLLIYAVVVTGLAVFVTYQLSKLLKTLEDK
jgi:sorbitol-specific phosphotransferase system component IIBC